MFDQNQSSPANLPNTGQPPVQPKTTRTEPGTEDIFADTDTALDKTKVSAVVPPVAPLVKSSTMAGPLEPLTKLPDDQEEESHGGKKILTIGLAVVVLGLLGLVGYYAYSKFLPSGVSLPNLNLGALPEKDLNANQNVNQVTGNENQNLNQETNDNQNFNQTAGLDSDGDGLTDEEEKDFYGTDPLESDSDGDGLFDKEEAKIYETNPLDPDTDHDGYIDGDEVHQGYNPRGSGKLLDLNNL